MKQLKQGGLSAAFGMADAAWGVEIIGKYAKSGTMLFPAARRNPLTDHSKSTKGRAAFILPSRSPPVEPGQFRYDVGKLSARKSPRGRAVFLELHFKQAVLRFSALLSPPSLTGVI